MKVECMRVINPVTGENQKSDSWLTVGNTYVVLSIMVVSGRDVQLRLLPHDHQPPALFDSRQFKTVCSKIPSNWIASLDGHGNLRLRPQRWTRPGFWEDYFNSEARALDDFERETGVIVAETG